MRMHPSESPQESPSIRRLVIAPHADDEALGCGGLLAKYHEDATVVVLAHLDDTRAREFEQARSVLGYANAYFLDLPDGSVGREMHSLVGLMDSVLNACKPHELYLPYPSLHQDHMATYEAGMRAARLSMTDGHWFPPTVMVYDVPAYDVTLYPTDLRWNVFEALDETHVGKKVEAVLAYDSQRVRGPHPANGIKQHAHAVGSARQVDWAEQYALVRSVRGVAIPPHPTRVHPEEALQVLAPSTTGTGNGSRHNGRVLP